MNIALRKHSVPRARSRPSGRIETAAARSIPLRRPGAAAATILLVEDDPYCRTTIRRLLVLGGYLVCEAAHGLEALGLLAQRRVDAVLTDVVMPVMDGLRLYEHLRQDHPELPVVVYTGGHSVNEDLRRELSSARRSAFLAKPFRGEELTTSLRQVLETDER